jgi:hypothetical protein
VDVASTVNVAGSVTTVEQPASVIVMPARVSVASAGPVTNLLAANLARKSATIQAINANTDIVMIGTTGVGLTAGLELQPGQPLVLRTTDAIYAYAATGTQIVQPVEEM